MSSAAVSHDLTTLDLTLPMGSLAVFGFVFCDLLYLDTMVLCLLPILLNKFYIFCVCCDMLCLDILCLL